MRMKARTAHDQTAERKYMVAHGREQGTGSGLVEGFTSELGVDEVDPVSGF